MARTICEGARFALRSRHRNGKLRCRRLGQTFAMPVPHRHDAAMAKLAFIGLGIMGGPMAGHLLAAGHTLVVNSRTKSKAQPLLDRGATWAATPAAAAKDADVIFTCVPDTPDVES